MSNTELKKLLRDQIDIEMNLLEVIKDCFGVIFKDRAIGAYYRFSECLDMYESQCYLPSIESLQKDYPSKDEVE